MFDGRKIRDQILEELKTEISRMERKPVMAVFLIGDDPVSINYVVLKQRFAEQIGIDFKLFKYDASANQDEVLNKIKEQGQDEDISGIMIQIPVPAGWDRDSLIRAIDPSKDIDGLRYCLGINSDFLPPVVLAIEAALSQSGLALDKSTVALVGRGFLVGDPMFRFLKNKVKKIIVADLKTGNLVSVTSLADIVISATGQAGLIKPEMVKDSVVLIDAGTSESGGKLVGDIYPATFTKSSFYTTVPGGIGPVTVAMLMRNLIKK